MTNNDPFGFCRSCSSPNVKVKNIDVNGNKLWECQDCGRQWNEYQLDSPHEENPAD